MSLVEQKNKFFATAKGHKALAYCKNLFSDFTTYKLEPIFLRYFYALEKFGDSVPVSAENEFNDYEGMFWFWFYKRLDRAQREHEIYLSNIEYERIIKELEASNPLNFFGDLFREGKNLLLLVGGGLLLYKFLGRRR